MTIEEDTEGGNNMSEHELNEILYGQDAQSPIRETIAYWEGQRQGTAYSPMVRPEPHMAQAQPSATNTMPTGAADAGQVKSGFETAQPVAAEPRPESIFSNANSESTIAESLMPPPLIVRKAPLPARQHSKRSSTAASRRFSNPQSIPEVEEDSFIAGAAAAHNTRPRPIKPFRPPSQTRSPSVISRISLTASDLPYLPRALQPNSAAYPSKAERMLGLQPPPRSASVEAQDSPRSDASESFNLEPLNGRTAWLHVLTGTFILFNCWGMANAFGLFQAYYVAVYLPVGTSPSAVSWIGSLQLALVFGLGAPVGRLVDKGYFRLMFHGGSVIMLLGLFCTAWCKALWSLVLVQGLLTGLGMGMVFCSGMVALMTWFDEKKLGVASALGAAGSCIGGMVYVLMARSLLISHGFATTMRIIGAVATATMIPPNLVFRVRGQHHKNAARKSVAQSSLRWSKLATPAYLTAAGGMFFAFLGVYFGFVYMVSFASTELQLSAKRSTDLLVFMLLANLPGRLLPGFISDRCIGPLNTMIPGIFLSAGCIVL